MGLARWRRLKANPTRKQNNKRIINYKSVFQILSEINKNNTGIGKQ